MLDFEEIFSDNKISERGGTLFIIIIVIARVLCTYKDALLYSVKREFRESLERERERNTHTHKDNTH